MEAKTILFVFIFGGIGSVARFFAGKLNPPVLTSVPWGTFAANFAACLIAGFAAGYFASRPWMKPEIRFSILTGFCGGFSTFSTFSVEAVQLFQNGNMMTAAGYILLSLTGCLLGVFAGIGISKTLS